MRLIQGLIASILIHFFLMGILSELQKEATQKEVQTIDVLYTEATQKQIVRQTSPPPSELTQNKESAKFWSLNKQRVKKQSKSAQTGLSKNRQETSSQQQDKKPLELPQKPKSTHQPFLKQKNDPLVPTLKTTNLHRPFLFEEKGTSTTGEFLPDIKIGEFTALNTDRYLFYSFFTRIEEAIRFRWEERVFSEIKYLSSRNFRSPPGKTSWKTHVIIQLNKKGLFKDASILQSSGIKGFDNAIIDSFQEARLFPNPPSDLIEEDGQIRLEYSFNVYWNPQDKLSLIR